MSGGRRNVAVRGRPPTMRAADYRRHIDEALRNGIELNSLLPPAAGRQFGASVGAISGERDLFLVELERVVHEIHHVLYCIVALGHPRGYPDTLRWALAGHETAVRTLREAADSIRPVRDGAAPSGSAWTALTKAASRAGFAFGQVLAYGDKARGGAKRNVTAAQSELQEAIAALALLPRAPRGAVAELAAKHYKQAASIKRAIARRRAAGKKG